MITTTKSEAVKVAQGLREQHIPHYDQEVPDVVASCLRTMRFYGTSKAMDTWFSELVRWSHTSPAANELREYLLSISVTEE